MTLQTKLFTALIILLAYLCFIYAFQIHQGAKDILHTDYGKFYRSTQFFQENKSIYSTTSIALPKAFQAFLAHTPEKFPLTHMQLAAPLNPPFFVFLTLPFGYLSYAASLWLWSLLSIICGVASILWCQKILNLSHNKTLTILFITLFFCYLPTFINCSFGQVTLLLLPLLIGAWHAVRRQHLITAGILLGILVSLKIIFGLFLIYFLWHRQWPAIISLLLTTLVCNLLPLPLLGWQSYIDYYQLMHHINWYAASWNASLYGFFTRLFGNNEFNTPLLSLPLFTPIFYALCGGLLILGLLFFFESPNNNLPQKTKCDLDFSCVIVSMLLLSPLGWLYYFPWLIIVFFTLVRIIEHHPQAFRLHLILAASIVLCGIPHVMSDSVLITPNNVLSVCLLSSAYVFSLFMNLALLYYLRFTKITYPTIENKINFNYTHLFIYGLAILQSLFGIEYFINRHVIFGI